MSALMMTMCTNACLNGSKGVRSTYHCDYSNAGHDGPHGPHDWFSYVYNEWQHCHGTTDSGE